MKKYKKIAYVLLIIIIAVLSVTVYANASKEDRENKQEKNFSEVEFLETKLLNLFNEMNNIEMRNYNISASEISTQAEDQKNSNSSQGNEQGLDSEGESSDSGTNKNSSNLNSSSDTQSKSSQKFDLVEKGILTKTEDVNWKDVKNEIEILYSSIPTITLDLYQSNTNQEDILNFNKEFDNLTIVVKEEKKEETLTELSKLYDYIPKFMENSTNDQLQKTVTETKANILKAYSKLDSKSWDEISNDIKQAINVYSKLLTDTNIDQSKQYTIGKIYVMINELQNAIHLQDESIFLIKYKNIIEEMNTLL